jgi:hypothetical protein
MSAIGGAKAWLVLSAVAALVAIALVPTVAGTASASPAPAATADPSNQWAYGGVGYSNNTLVVGSATLTWNATFGWAVIFTKTSTGPNTTELEEQRTVGINVMATYSGPYGSAMYTYHGQEVDVAFANLTNASTVYINGGTTAVPALGLLNDTTFVSGKIAEAISLTHDGVTKTASLNVMATADIAATFTPALGLIPLNLTGVNEWNSTATITPVGTWNITWAWANNGFGNSTGSGSGGANGTAGVAGTVDLTGYNSYREFPVPSFPDHTVRTSIILVVEGPRGNFAVYDGFILQPWAFQLFGAGVGHGYDADAYGSAEISAQALYVSSSPSGPQVTAGATTFGATDAGVSALAATTQVGPSPAASSSPGTTVEGAPMSVAQAQGLSNQLTGGGSAAASGPLSLGLIVVVAGLGVVAVVGSIAVIEWRSYARRRARKGLVGGYAESWTNGVPPAASGPTPPSGTVGSTGGPSAPEMPPRQP